MIGIEYPKVIKWLETTEDAEEEEEEEEVNK